MTTAQIVASARGWIGTPFVHRASVRGSGADCLGLLCGVWRDVFRAVPADVPFYTADWSEPQGHEVLWRALQQHMVPKAADGDAVGDVLLFRMRDGAVAKHCAVQTACGARASFVHSYMRHGVVETSLSEPWRRRLVARFSFPLIEKG